MKRNIFKIFVVLMVLTMVVSPATAQTPQPTGDAPQPTGSVKWEKAVEPDTCRISLGSKCFQSRQFIILFEKHSLASVEREVSETENIEQTDEIAKLESISPVAKSYLKFLRKDEHDRFIDSAGISTVGRKLADRLSL